MAATRSKNACVLCGKNPAEGWAWVDDRRYCHGDDDELPTCYMRAQTLDVAYERLFPRGSVVPWTVKWDGGNQS